MYHSTEKLIIKQADVDSLMIPVIKYLNLYESIFTLYCCQGEPDPPDPFLLKDIPYENRPYISWICLDSFELMLVLKTFGTMVNTQIQWDFHRNCISYRTEFPCQKYLIDFSNNIVKNNSFYVKNN